LNKVVIELPQEDCNRTGLFDEDSAQKFAFYDMPGVEDGDFMKKIHDIVK
jgi:hypothetical protein